MSSLIKNNSTNFSKASVVSYNGGLFGCTQEIEKRLLQGVQVYFFIFGCNSENHFSDCKINPCNTENYIQLIAMMRKITEN